MTMETYAGPDPLKVLRSVREQMNGLSPEPREGWAEYLIGDLVKTCFPREGGSPAPAGAERAAELYYNALSTARKADRLSRPFDFTVDIDFLPREAYRSSRIETEYERLKATFERCHIPEMLLLSRALRPYNILAHVALVHHTALTLAERAKAAGVPVDVALVSAAAAAHDLGKFACLGEEALRVPYLHYYYTDTFLRGGGMPKIAHIASNHSTWDLETENLCAESLFLIYADFRSATVRIGKREEARLLPLPEAYAQLIRELNPEDGEKNPRCARVYRKLCDFEDYLKSLGISCDPDVEACDPAPKTDPALMTGAEAAKALRLMTVSGNISIMSDLGSERNLSALLERMRTSEEDLRSFLAVLSEYHAYTSRQQKLMILRFLYDQLMQREGDIRRDAARLMGQILAGGGGASPKGRPDGAPDAAHAPTLEEGLESRARLSATYLEMLLHPDHKISFKHRARVMHALKTVVLSAVLASSGADASSLIAMLMDYLPAPDADACFALLDTLAALPPERLADEQRKRAIDVASSLQNDRDAALATAACRLLDRFHAPQRGKRPPKEPSDLFLENLKSATPWIVKVDNIDALTRLSCGDPDHAFHTAAHLSNLLRVSEHLSVREYAGQALIAIAPRLTPDQCNEIVVDLWRGLESARYEITRYIPPCLGRLALMLPERELDETIDDLEEQFRSADASTASMSLSTLGVILSESIDETRDERLLGLMLTGLAHDAPAVRREAMRILGHMVFSSEKLARARRGRMFCRVAKKLLTLIDGRGGEALLVYSRAAMLNRIYRFMTDYEVESGAFPFPKRKDAAFFLGTFDPFSTGHKGIVDAILKLNLEVYLALDEFAWDKRTQPKLMRRRIAEMTVADRPDVFLFPDNLPVNIENPGDLKRLREIFAGRNVSIVSGSDVISHASAYVAPAKEGSIHAFDHIVFARNSGDTGEAGTYDAITGHVWKLSLPVYLEDVSSSRIRDSIDKNLDLSTLVDPIAQRFIFEKGLYLRSPQDKSVRLPRAVNFHRFTATNTTLLRQIFSMNPGLNPKDFSERLTRHGENAVALYRDQEELPCGAGFFHYADGAKLLSELRDPGLASRIRAATSGQICFVDGIYAENNSKGARYRLILSEALAAAVGDGCTYALCRSFGLDKLKNALLSHGFLPVGGEEDLYLVDMRAPIVLLSDAKERLKEPLRSNARIINSIEIGASKLQQSLTRLYPGELVLSFDSDVLIRQLIRRVTTANHVPFTPSSPKRTGDFMCVPYARLLSDMVVPNTVTKTLHTDQVYSADLTADFVKAYPGYSSLRDQVLTLRSFGRKALLIADCLDTGRRLDALTPLLQEAGIDVERVILGVLSGRGRDRLELEGRAAEAVYSIPNLRCMLTDSMLYPFIGGDSITAKPIRAGLVRSVNFVYPYASPRALEGAERESLIHLSRTALTNALDILNAVEDEHAFLFERSLTVGRLGEAMLEPRVPDRGASLRYNDAIAPSDYIKADLDTLRRMDAERAED